MSFATSPSLSALNLCTDTIVLDTEMIWVITCPQQVLTKYFNSKHEIGEISVFEFFCIKDAKEGQIASMPVASLLLVAAK